VGVVLTEVRTQVRHYNGANTAYAGRSAVT
jgi:hypothetical protein